MSVRVFPEALPDIAGIASVLANPSRAVMCAALMDGRAWTVGELGRYAGLARSTASEHVDLLVERGFVMDVRQGRHRYVRLAGDDVARVIESLGSIATASLPTPPVLRAWTRDRTMRDGRTCYRHLAGRLGVDLTAALRQRGFIQDNWQVTPSGRSLLESWGIAPGQLGLADPCMDSIERRFHLGGPLGAAVCRALLDRSWIERLGSTRAVRLTATGESALRSAGLGIRSGAQPVPSRSERQGSARGGGEAAPD